MRPIIKALAFAATLVGTNATAENATVVELYTSQGCSSCPPADAMLTDIAKQPGVIALALHVDYWDYLGWKDDLANPAYTRRQHDYARAAGTATVYTPQMIFGGVDHVVGSRPNDVMTQLMKHNGKPDAVDLTLSRSGNTLQISGTSNGLRDTLVVQLVRYTPNVSRDIRRGENAGKTINYTNVVTSWANIGEWRTTSPLALQANVTGNQPIVVIVQDGAAGPIVGAAQLR